MARLIHHSVEVPRGCSYLPHARAALENRVMVGVTAEEYETLLVRGWRRFGPVYFRPACPQCEACDSLRLPVARFVPTRSQRKAHHRCAHFRREVGPPQVDPERLALYARWHAFRAAAREWAPNTLDARTYAEQFAFPHPCAREVAWYDDSAPEGTKLQAVALCDETPSAWSLVYFFYAPTLARLSPGAANIVFAVDEARARGLTHLYLGYRVHGCPSLEYKGRFGPHEQLLGRPSAATAPIWFPESGEPTRGGGPGPASQ